MKRLLVILLLIFCSGAHCGTPRDGGALLTRTGHEFYWSSDSFPIQVHINPDLPLIIKDEIYLAVLHWNDVVGAEVFQTSEVITNTEIPILGVISIDRKKLRRNSRGQRIRGQAQVHLYTGQSGRNGRIYSVSTWLDLDLEISRVCITTIHELGHALSLRHDGDPKSAMYYTTSFDQILMKEDIDRVRNMMRRN